MGKQIEFTESELEELWKALKGTSDEIDAFFDQCDYSDNEIIPYRRKMSTLGKAIDKIYRARFSKN